MFSAGREDPGMRLVNIPSVEDALVSRSSQNSGKLHREENKETHTPSPSPVLTYQ